MTINILYEQLHGNYMFIEVSDVLTDRQETLSPANRRQNFRNMNYVKGKKGEKVKK